MIWQPMQKKVLTTIGWREWVGLPDLGIEAVNAKVDTGARSSALHAFNIEAFERDGVDMVRFAVHPIQRDSKITVECEAPMLERRWVKSSVGHRTFRPVIETQIAWLGQTWDIELTLVNRDEMGFRMLIGRQAMRSRLLVDPSRSFIGPKPAHAVRPQKKKRKKKRRKRRQ